MWELPNAVSRACSAFCGTRQHRGAKVSGVRTHAMQWVLDVTDLLGNGCK